MLNSKNLAIAKHFGDKTEFTTARFHCTLLKITSDLTVELSFKNKVCGGKIIVLTRCEQLIYQHFAGAAEPGALGAQLRVQYFP